MTDSSSSRLSGQKRGSREAAATALLFTSCSSRRRAFTEPTQPRKLQSRVRVTKDAPGLSSHHALGVRGTGRSSECAIAARASASNIAPRSMDMACLLTKSKRSVTNDATLVACGVTGVAQIEKLRLEAVQAASEQQPVYWRSAARLFKADCRR